LANHQAWAGTYVQIGWNQAVDRQTMTETRATHCDERSLLAWLSLPRGLPS